MTEFFEAVTSPLNLLWIVLIFGLAPGLVLRVLVLLYPVGDPRRRELVAELYIQPRIERPLWVGEQLETAFFEGLGERWAQRTRGARQRVYRVSTLCGWLGVGITSWLGYLSLGVIVPWPGTTHAVPLGEMRFEFITHGPSQAGTLPDPNGWVGGARELVIGPELPGGLSITAESFCWWGWALVLVLVLWLASFVHRQPLQRRRACHL